MQINKLAQFTWAKFWLPFLLNSLLNGANASLRIPLKPDNIFTLNGQQSGFRAMALNQGLSSLYVGSRGHLFRLWLYNINDTSSATLYSKREFQVRPEEREECLRLGNTANECDFWVRQIFQRGDGSLLLCSSQAMKPQLGPVDGQTLADLQEARTQIGICSQHEGLNTTAIYAESGNPDGLPAIYSGIATGLTLENHLIYRPPLMSADGGKEVHPALRTSIYDNTWLSEPQFVGSFSLGPHVFFFFRELLATDCFNCPGTSAGTGKGTWVSRVARVCKSDLGGRQVLRQVWTSFVKARLNCSLPGFSFDQIQGVARVDLSEESGTPSDTIFYATFTAAEQTPFQASAICAYSLNRINQLFDTGLFLEQAASGSGSWWNPTPVEQVPQNRPGSCQPDSRQLSDEELHFAKSHLLMAEPVQPQGGQPLLHRRSELLTTILADPLGKTASTGEGQQVLLFVYSQFQNTLLKVLHQQQPQQQQFSTGHLLSMYELPTPAEKVHSMAILPGEYLYLSTDSKVLQFRIGQCAAYGDSCIQCVRDPHCSWSIPRRECFPKESAHMSAVGWLAGGRTEEATQRCAKWTKPKPVRLFPGDSVHLECTGADQLEGVRWAHNGKIVSSEQSVNRVNALGGGIVLLNVTTEMAGIWACQSERNMENGEPLILVEYSLDIDGEDCAKPKSVEQFHAVQREWCRKMDAYRSNLSKWQTLYENGDEANAENCPTNEQQRKNKIQ